MMCERRLSLWIISAGACYQNALHGQTSIVQTSGGQAFGDQASELMCFVVRFWMT